MTIAARIIGEAPGILWGLTTAERLERQLRALGVALAARDAAAPAARVLLLSAHYVFDHNALSGLLAKTRGVLLDDEGGRAAAVVPADITDTVAQALTDPAQPLPDLPTFTPAELEGYDRKLRRAAPPLLRRYSEGERDALESLLYGNAYKGITDLVTKWWWPRPARVIVGWCARARITPNMVTLFGFALVIAAMFLFREGWYWSGLACGWLMTLLDTVDGKLARVTITSSPIGHVLDHGLDLVHPPFWYVWWGLGLGAVAPLGIEAMAWQYVIVGGYVGGRLIEILFHRLGHCGMFAWRPFDAWFRLVTARRNPCLIIMTVLLPIAGPVAAWVGVALWTAASTAIMLLRLLYATVVRLGGEPLDSWLRDPTQAAAAHPRSWRTFSATRGAFRAG